MKFFVVLISIFLFSFVYGQNGIRLISSSLGNNTIDTYKKTDDPTLFDLWSDYKNVKQKLAYASVPVGKSVVFTFRIDTSRIDFSLLKAVGNDKRLEFPIEVLEDRCYVTVGNESKATMLSLLVGSDEYSRVQLYRYSVKQEQLVLVPLYSMKLNSDSISSKLNRVFEAANLQFNVIIDSKFRLKSFPETRLFRNPSEANERYTSEMRYIRDAYLKKHPELKSSYLVFIVPGFKNDSLTSYCVKNKALGFAKNGSSLDLSLSIAELIGSGTLGLGENEIARDNATIWFRHLSWKKSRLNASTYQFLDDYEDIATTTGLVAYYFWRENSLGNIEIPSKGTKNPLRYILRPYKRNTYSYHLQLDNYLVKTIFSIKGIPFNALHLLSIIASIWLWIFLGKRIRIWIKLKWKFPRLFRVMSWPFLISSCLVSGYGAFLLVNLVYVMFEIRAGEIDELKGSSVNGLVQKIQTNNHPRLLAEGGICSEILMITNETVRLRQSKSVLYFEALTSASGMVETFRFTDSKKDLVLETFEKPKKALNHYFVIRFKDTEGKLIKEEVYNFGGVRITQTLKAKDPVKRILVFVNGYRPTSLGSSFQEHFSDIQKNGLEYPNSQNHLYAFDRYNYWNPWNNMDGRFKKHFLPSETYYADGHFSVSTSNYRSLINFTTASTKYPKRCSHKKRHHCYTVSSVNSKLLGTRRKKTLSIINYRSNKSGFSERRKNGRVAGRNLFHQLNELPNRSKNDTLYIVAHSMGYAYALGIIDELRGKINFGSFVIIAPENAGAGGVLPSEWKEIWQYGSKRKTNHDDAPCLQDGVAPQVLVKGLPSNNRVYIPKRDYKHKGFFDSHFIGYYTWIFELKATQKGYLKPH